MSVDERPNHGDAFDYLGGDQGSEAAATTPPAGSYVGLFDYQPLKLSILTLLPLVLVCSVA
jgi:hypothetical protein